MKITGIETIRIAERPNPIWLQAQTGEGLAGLGETFLGAETVATYVHAEQLAPRVLGQDPRRIERLALAAPNALIRESVRAFCRTWYRDLVAALPEVENGMLTVPEGPGLGLELLPDLDRAFTTKRRLTRQEENRP